MAAPPRCDIRIDPTANDVVSCVQNGSLRGIPSDSASPTDVYIFEFNPNTYFRGDKVERGFMKVFVSNPQNPFLNSSYKDEIGGLNYEISIYERTKKLVDNNIIGHFVKYFTSLMSPTKFDNLKNFIRDKANISDTQARNNLSRNTIFMLYDQRNIYRPAITDNSVIITAPSSSSFSLLYKNYVRYRFILTEAVIPYDIYPMIPAMPSTIIQNFKNMPPGNSIKLGDINDFFGKIISCNSAYLSSCEYLRDTILEIYFQLAVTTYAMFLNKFVHNDLHDGNVWIKRTDPKNIKYTLRQVAGFPSYTLTNCINFSMLYDYDRAYRGGSYNLPNPLNNDRFYQDHNQSNHLIEQRDFVKILCYFMNNLLPSLRKIAGTLKRNVSNKDNMKTQIYKDLLDCICKKNIIGFVNVPISSAGIHWQPNRIKWPNDIDRYKDFWDSIFNNIVVTTDASGNKITSDTYKCFLNETAEPDPSFIGQFNKRHYGFLNPALYTETLHPMPVIINNIANLINTYTPGKIRINDGVPGDYNYDVKLFLS